jgi:hypothetical protein
MKSKENNLEKNISRLVKLAGDSNEPGKVFADSVVKNALDELKGTKAEREGNGKFVKVKWKRTLSWAAVVLVVCGIGFGILISNAGKMRKTTGVDFSGGPNELVAKDSGVELVVEETSLPTKFDVDEAYESLKVSKELDVSILQSEPNYNMPLAVRAVKPKNIETRKPAASTPVDINIAMSHGPVKDGLAAFLICEQSQFKLDEPLTLLYGVVYGGPAEKVTILAPGAAVDPGNISWLSITGPDGNDVPYIGVYVMFPLPDPKDALQLRRRRFYGRLAYNIRDSFKLCTPGTYTIKWHCEMRPVDGVSCWTGELVSNEIQIEVVK